MPLPHFTQLQMTGSPGGPGTQPQEPVYQNLFEITFVLPTILQAQGRDPVLLLQQAKKISLNVTNKDLGISEQKFKYSSRFPAEKSVSDEKTARGSGQRRILRVLF